MNIAMEQTEEYVNGQLKAKYGDAFIRGNNGASERPRSVARFSRAVFATLALIPRVRDAARRSMRLQSCTSARRKNGAPKISAAAGYGLALEVYGGHAPRAGLARPARVRACAPRG
jgi:hypothetical protein